MISIIIPVYNGEKYLKETIETALNQKGDFEKEVLVVDDGSTDQTADIAKEFGTKITYLHQKNSGVSAARNLGASVSKGEYLAFIDADDLWKPNKIERQLAEIKNSDMVFTHIEHFNCSEKYTQCEKPMAGYFSTTLFIRKQAYEKTGGYSENVRYGEFIDWYSRAKKLGLKETLIDEVLAYRRIHDNNMTTQQKSSYGSVLKAHLNRMRNQ